MTTPTTVNVRLQLRADTAANWTAANPILLANEVGLETDTKKLKVGNGSTAWNSLAYFPSIVSGGTVLGNLEIGSTGTLTFEGSTADGFETTLAVTNPTADRTITLPNQSGTVVVSGNASIVDADIAANAEIAVSKLADGAARQLLQTDAAGTGVEWTSNVDIPGTLDVTGTATFDGAVTVAGDLTVNGTTTTISTQNLLVEDKNIIIGDVATPTDVTADGGGITLKGATDKTINWVDATDAWTSSEHINIASGKEYRIAGTSVLTGTTLGSGITSSSLTSVGTLGSLTVTGANTAGTFIPTSGTAPSNGLYLPAANSVALSTNSSERLRITSAGLVGVGTSSPQVKLQIEGSGAYTQSLRLNDSSGANKYIDYGFDGTGPYLFTPASYYAFNVASAERMRLTSTGLGVGTTSPSALLTVGAAYGGTPNSESRTVIQSAGNSYLTIGAGSSSQAGLLFADTAANNAGGILYTHSSDSLEFVAAGNERARIDSSGRLLVGTSSARGNFFNSTVSPLIQQEGISGSGRFMSVTYGTASEDDPIFILGKHRGASIGGNTVVANGDGLGKISFQGSDGSELVEGAAIRAEVDGTPGANDMPGRLVFSTCGDGASSPTERMRIDSAGRVLIGTTDTLLLNNVTTGEGCVLEPSGGLQLARSGDSCLYINRLASDGELVRFYQDGNQEGTISVSGSTVSYNGAHLSRWSQLPGGATRKEILRGTVLSNIDEMCEWDDEENEQLNRMKVSHVEGDKNVSGVFQAWDDDDDTYTNDFYCAMTGDFIIRIGAGVTVERGDLLMSAGDGTAKPQDDDIIRSKTVAKVTSTNVSCTYDDGSYCVPCVLMAC